MTVSGMAKYFEMNCSKMIDIYISRFKTNSTFSFVILIQSSWVQEWLQIKKKMKVLTRKICSSN